MNSQLSNRPKRLSLRAFQLTTVFCVGICTSLSSAFETSPSRTFPNIEDSTPSTSVAIDTDETKHVAFNLEIVGEISPNNFWGGNPKDQGFLRFPIATEAAMMGDAYRRNRIRVQSETYIPSTEKLKMPALELPIKPLTPPKSR